MALLHRPPPRTECACPGPEASSELPPPQVRTGHHHRAMQRAIRLQSLVVRGNLTSDRARCGSSTPRSSTLPLQLLGLRTARTARRTDASPSLAVGAFWRLQRASRTISTLLFELELGLNPGEPELQLSVSQSPPYPPGVGPLLLVVLGSCLRLRPHALGEVETAP